MGGGGREDPVIEGMVEKAVTIPDLCRVEIRVVWTYS